ncbi:MAG: hypothetical protein Q9162_001528 [Coniocarpon cinnabarinum]
MFIAVDFLATLPRYCSKQFSTGQQLMWQIKMSEIIRMNGPKLPKKAERTYICSPRQFLKDTHHEWEDSAGGKMKANPTEMSTESDVCVSINHTNGTWGAAIENFMPELVKYLQIPGKIEFPSQFTVLTSEGKSEDSSRLLGASRPDIVMTYNGYPVAALDYKGPNCINYARELELCGASDEQEAKKRALKIPLSNAKAKPDSLMYHKGISKTSCYLIQAMARYAQVLNIAHVAEYDYDNLLMLKINPTSVGKANGGYFPDAYICEEKIKSTETNFVWSADNHVNVTIRFLLDAIEAHRKKHGEDVLNREPESKFHQAVEGVEKSIQAKLAIR